MRKNIVLSTAAILGDQNLRPQLLPQGSAPEAAEKLLDGLSAALLGYLQQQCTEDTLLALEVHTVK